MIHVFLPHFAYGSLKVIRCSEPGVKCRDLWSLKWLENFWICVGVHRLCIAMEVENQRPGRSTENIDFAFLRSAFFNITCRETTFGSLTLYAPCHMLLLFFFFPEVPPPTTRFVAGKMRTNDRKLREHRGKFSEIIGYQETKSRSFETCSLFCTKKQLVFCCVLCYIQSGKQSHGDW